MTRSCLCLASLLTFALTVPGLAGAGDGAADVGVERAKPGKVDLSYRTYRDWKIQLPNEKFSPVGVGFRLAAGLGVDFDAAIEGTSLLIDSDGDGKTDVKADGDSALIKLIGKNGSGQDFTYAVRLFNRQGWQFAASGAMVGKLNGTKIQLIDQNNNGSYADFGEDAMIVGRGKVACFLSRVINVGGQLYDISIAKGGHSLAYSPYQGETGTFRLGPCETKAKVLGAIVRTQDGISFDMAKAAEGIEVPAGDYTVHNGEIGLGQSRVKFRTGRSQPLAVGPGETRDVSWGGPVKAEFAYRRTDDQVQLAPNQVWYFGAAGEEYHNWNPIGKSPKFTISNFKTGREIAQAYFPGTC